MQTGTGSKKRDESGASVPVNTANTAASTAGTASQGGGGMRLNVFVASAAGVSRREADRLIEAGRIRVNGSPGVSGMKVSPEDVTELDGKRLFSVADKTVVAFYKPVGVTCTERDPHAERTLKDVFRYDRRLTYAGRLDRDSEGLLLMTDDGKLIDAMMSSRSGHEKEYLVETAAPVTDAQLRKMAGGILLTQLGVRTRPCKITRTGKNAFRIILTQGLNRQIRRMCGAVGAQVVRLKRVRVLNVQLGEMRPGEQRRITGGELETLYREAGLPRTGTEKRGETRG